MFKKIILGLTIFLQIATPGALVLAQNFGLDATAQKAQYSENTDIYGAISIILRVALSAVGIVFLAIMFYAGLRWMTARGNEEHTTKAKDAMFNVILGLILVVLAYGLTVFIFGKLLQ